MLVDGQEVDVGDIMLKFDPNLIGDAENIEYSLLVNGELTFGALERISSTPILHAATGYSSVHQTHIIMSYVIDFTVKT